MTALITQTVRELSRKILAHEASVLIRRCRVPPIASYHCGIAFARLKLTAGELDSPNMHPGQGDSGDVLPSGLRGLSGDLMR